MKVKNNFFFVLLAFLCTTFLFGQTPVPVPVQISERIENIDGVYYHLHTVERGQTLYSISRAYQVATVEIRRTSDKPEIQIGEILMLPISAGRLRTLRREGLLPEVKSKDTILKTEEETARKEFANPQKSVLNVALMLPLYLNEVDRIRITPRDTRVPRPFSFVSFYEGVVLATQAFDGGNVKINVRVFDVTEDENSATRLINNEMLNDVDIIIGPVFARAFGVMSEFAKQQNIFIINPLSERDDILLDNPYVVRINTTEKNQLRALLTHIVQEDVEQQILIVSNDSLPQERERAEFARLFFQAYYSHLNTPVFVDISKDRMQRFRNLLSNTESNAIVYLSDNEAFATEILTQLSRRGNTPNVLYCLRKLSQLESTEVRHLNDLQTHYVDPFYVDYDCEEVKNFERLFFETYRTLPNNQTYLGYDVMRFVLQLLKAGNTNYGNLLETTGYRGLQNSIHLHRADPSQGLENRQTNILKIENSRQRKVND